MLVKLFVQNYALIKELDVELENGLTIITGETGAGKSILLGALSLILGTRTDTSVLLDKNEKCIVEGTFRIEEYDLAEFFQANELDYEPLTLLRREINPAGKSRAFINDTPVKANLLKEIGERLIDIHSQHQTLMLNDNSFQLSLIDSFAGTSGLLQNYRMAYSVYRRLKKEYALLKESEERNRSDMEYYQFQIAQLEDAKLKQGEQEELEAEQELLAHAEEIKAVLAGSVLLFSNEDLSILSLLREVRVNISRIKSYLPEAEGLYSRTDSSLIELDDLAAEMEKLAAKVEADPKRLDLVNDRLDQIYSLMQKHRVTSLNELFSKTIELKEHLITLVSGDERLNELETLLLQEESKLKNISEEMSAIRMSVLPELELKVTDLLKQLGMPNAKFRIEFFRAEEFKPTGTDTADFLFSANKQVEIGRAHV